MRYFLVLLMAFGIIAAPLIAEPIATPPDSTDYGFSENSTMTVYGSSNVRDWTMDVKQINGTVVLGTADQALPAIEKIRVEVPVQQMVSDKDRLQRHAHDALKKEDHPTITFASSDVEVTEAQADSFSVAANGTLTIAGESHSVTLTAKGLQQSDDTLKVKGEHELLLSTFDVERPSLMFGAIKVDDKIQIGFDVALSPRSD